MLSDPVGPGGARWGQGTAHLGPSTGGKLSSGSNHLEPALGLPGQHFPGRPSQRTRKYWPGLVTISQGLGDFLANPYGHPVLANSATKLLLRQDASMLDEVQEALGPSPAASC